MAPNAFDDFVLCILGIYQLKAGLRMANAIGLLQICGDLHPRHNRAVNHQNVQKTDYPHSESKRRI